MASSGPCRRQPEAAGRQHRKIGAGEGGVSPGGGVAGTGVREAQGGGGRSRRRRGWSKLQEVPGASPGGGGWGRRRQGGTE